MFTEEVASKSVRNITARTSLARFPLVKPLDAFDFGYQPPLGAWGEVFDDGVVATAILDRVLHQEKAAHIAGLDRTEFLAAVAREKNRRFQGGS